MPDRTGAARGAGPDQTGASIVRLLAFAGARDIVGAAELDLDIAGARTAGELWPVLLGRFPGLEPYRASIRMAVNGTYATAADPVAAGDEVALIPPVAGG